MLWLDAQGGLLTTTDCAQRIWEQSRQPNRTATFEIWLHALQSQIRFLPDSAWSEGWCRVELPGCTEAPGLSVADTNLCTYVCRTMAADVVCGYVCTFVPSDRHVPGDQYLSRFFELSLDLCCIADLDGYFRVINGNFSRRLGYRDEELTGRPFLSFIHPDDVSATQAEMTRLTEGREVIAFRNRYRDTHGNYSWFEWTARAVLEDGLVFASARDVTERIRIEQQLIAHEQRERAILDNTSAVIYVKDLQGRYQFVNREFARLFQVSQADAAGKTDFDLFPEALATEFQKNDQRVLETKSPLKIEEVAPHADGLHSYLSVKFPLFDATGETVSVAGISTDISDRVWVQRTNQELRLAQEVQRRLFPSGDFVVTGFDIHGKVMAASHLCGDYFDFIRRSDGSIVFCVADVSGHGLAPALEMVEMRAMLRMLLKEDRPLEDTVTALNRLLLEDMPDGMFVTMFLAELQPLERRFRYVGAGHDAVLFRRCGGVQRLPSTGVVLGLFDVAEFQLSRTFEMNLGDILLITTDGIHETQSPEQDLFGHERVERIVSLKRSHPAAFILNELFCMAHAFSQQPLPRDDMTAIIIKAVPDAGQASESNR